MGRMKQPANRIDVYCRKECKDCEVHLINGHIWALIGLGKSKQSAIRAAIRRLERFIKELEGMLDENPAS